MVNHHSFDPKTYTRRNSHRLPSYDYRSSGAYFITICPEKRQRDYCEHMIRNEEDLELTREYIVNNPLKALLMQEQRDEESKRARARRDGRP